MPIGKGSRSTAVRHWSDKPGVVISNLNGGGEMLRESKIVVVGKNKDEKEVVC